MITTEQRNAISGTGIAYPISFSINGQAELLSLVTGSPLINQSIHTILATRIGERYNNVEFGSRLMELVFEPHDSVTKDLAYYYTNTALQRWEKRIILTGIRFVVDASNDAFLGIWIGYTEVETGNTGSYVFPFQTGGEPMDSLNTGTLSLG